MASRLTLRLVTLATAVDSLLGAFNVNRALVEMPAWQRAGPLAWAAYSRHADLGRTAMFLYPTEAFTGVILSSAAALSFRRDGSKPRTAMLPLYAAALLTVSGLLTTLKAAPNMLSVRDLDEDSTALQSALNGFQFWGNIRGVFQVLAFLSNFWSLLTLVELRGRA